MNFWALRWVVQRWCLEKANSTHSNHKVKNKASTFVTRIRLLRTVTNNIGSLDFSNVNVNLSIASCLLFLNASLLLYSIIFNKKSYFTTNEIFWWLFSFIKNSWKLRKLERRQKFNKGFHWSTNSALKTELLVERNPCTVFQGRSSKKPQVTTSNLGQGLNDPLAVCDLASRLQSSTLSKTNVALMMNTDS